MVFAWKTVPSLWTSMASPKTPPLMHQRTACVISFLASSKSTFSISRRASPMDILCFTTSITNLYLHHNGDTIVFTRPLLPISRRSRKYHGLGALRAQRLKNCEHLKNSSQSNTNTCLPDNANATQNTLRANTVETSYRNNTLTHTHNN